MSARMNAHRVGTMGVSSTPPVAVAFGVRGFADAQSGVPCLCEQESPMIPNSQSVQTATKKKPTPIDVGLPFHEFGFAGTICMSGSVPARLEDPGVTLHRARFGLACRIRARHSRAAVLHPDRC